LYDSAPPEDKVHILLVDDGPRKLSALEAALTQAHEKMTASLGEIRWRNREMVADEAVEKGVDIVLILWSARVSSTHPT
jgi:response regulator RpfG family c-di-GMP phosphodiesterase